MEHGVQAAGVERDPALAGKSLRQVSSESVPEGAAMAYCKEENRHYLVHADGQKTWKETDVAVEPR